MFRLLVTGLILCLTQIEIYAQQSQSLVKGLGYVFAEYNGFVVVEAEELSYSDNWQLLTEREGFTGKGYLQWVGGAQGQAQETDPVGRSQGNPDDWLVVPVQITKTGVYHVDLRNTHEHKDKDNDVWVHVAGWPPPVRRMGDHAEKTFQWLTWGPDDVSWKITRKGLYYFYVAGRSNHFAIDRIAVYHEDAPVKLKNKSMAVSKKYNPSQFR